MLRYIALRGMIITRRRVLLAVLGIIALVLFAKPWFLPYPHVYNYWVAKNGSPSSIPRPGRVPHGGLGTPPFVNELLCSRWPGEFPASDLTRPQYDSNNRLISPAFLMLHIPSINTPNARRRRELIRIANPLHAIPPAYRHLVELKFILGQPDPEEALMPGVIAEERQIEVEQKRFGDVVRLNGLEGGENMDHGKTLEWLRWVGNGKRQAQWVVKCDDDTLPILPNLLPLLLEQNASVPTYFGSHTGAFVGTHYHYEGMMYGFNWGVVRTFAVTQFPRSEVIKFFPEDGRSGELMYSLPSAPHCPPLDVCQTSSNSSTHSKSLHSPRRLPPYPPATPPPKHPKLPHSNSPCDPMTPPGGRTWDHHPPNPDPRTGLIRWDLGTKMGRWQHWWIAGPEKAVAYHYLKKDAEYLHVHDRIIRTFHKLGREYIWTPPKHFWAYADDESGP